VSSSRSITDEEIDDIDARTSFQTQLVLLAALIADARLDDSALGSFMDQARDLANQ
jgi:hypothetical protein